MKLVIIIQPFRAFRRARDSEEVNREDDSTRGTEASQDHDDKDKREERREKSEERREKKEEKRDPKRGRQRSPNEAAVGGPTLFSAIPPLGGTSGGFEGRGKRAEKREKREEKRENTFFFVFR